jgi:hypothetical protein
MPRWANRPVQDRSQGLERAECPGRAAQRPRFCRRANEVLRYVHSFSLTAFNQTNILPASKGFTPIDLAALIGAHTAARQRFVDPARANATFDSTPGTWDTKFYSETKKGRAPFTIEADKNIAQNPITAIPFATFALSKTAWDLAFVSAMTKMSMVGVNPAGMVDCTSALPGGSRKRDVKRSDLWERMKW